MKIKYLIRCFLIQMTTAFLLISDVSSSPAWAARLSVKFTEDEVKSALATLNKAYASSPNLLCRGGFNSTEPVSEDSTDPGVEEAQDATRDALLSTAIPSDPALTFIQVMFEPQDTSSTDTMTAYYATQKGCFRFMKLAQKEQMNAIKMDPVFAAKLVLAAREINTHLMNKY